MKCSRKVLALLLVAVMVFAVFPAVGLAESNVVDAASLVQALAIGGDDRQLPLRYVLLHPRHIQRLGNRVHLLRFAVPSD